MSEVDIVIATRDRGDLIDATLESIRRSAHADFNLWVVDQSADDATRLAVDRHVTQDARVHYIHSDRVGVSPARNKGAALGHAPYIAFTDDDCIAAPSWLGALLSELEQPETWAVFGRVIPDAGLYAPHGVKPASPAIPMALKDSPQRKVYNRSRLDLGFGHGANMAVRRDRFASLNGYDEMLGVGAVLRSWGDRDFGFRILKAGGAIVYTPDALIIHRHWRGWADVRRQYHNYAVGAGAAAGKYIRCGDPAGVYIFVEWLLDQGVRQVASGLLKWRSGQKIQAGLMQLVYPWVGLAQCARYPVDRARVMFRSTQP